MWSIYVALTDARVVLDGLPVDEFAGAELAGDELFDDADILVNFRWQF